MAIRYIGGTQLGVSANGTMIWGQEEMQNTSGNVLAAALMACTELAGTLAYYAYEGCGWGAAWMVADLCLGDLSEINVLAGCILLGMPPQME